MCLLFACESTRSFLYSEIPVAPHFYFMQKTGRGDFCYRIWVSGIRLVFCGCCVEFGSVLQSRRSPVRIRSRRLQMGKRKNARAPEPPLPMAEFSALPEYMKDNEYIVGHYRVEWPLKHAFLSLFSIHNETLNVWTHFVGFLLFLFLTIYTATKLPSVPTRDDLWRWQKALHLPNMAEFRDELRTALPEWVGDCIPGNFGHPNATHHCIFQTLREDVSDMVFPHLQTPITRWPFLIFLGAATYCLFASTTFHLFSCYSKKMYYALLRLDYSGIAALIAASFYPPVYYSFMCDSFFRNFYLTTITLLGCTSVIVSLLPAFQNPEYRTFRAVLFSGMGIWGVAPVLHKFILHKDQPEALHTTAYEIGMGCFYALGAILYATRIPERWKPGMFDIAGHSHQLFHVLVIAGAYTHYQAGLLYLKWRDAKGC